MSIVVVVALGRSQAGSWADSVSQQFLSFFGPPGGATRHQRFARATMGARESDATNATVSYSVKWPWWSVARALPLPIQLSGRTDAVFVSLTVVGKGVLDPAALAVGVPVLDEAPGPRAVEEAVRHVAPSRAA